MSKNLLGARAKQLFGIDRPFAITMWDFSWLERRWPGAGYEDWDAALGELTDRGYEPCASMRIRILSPKTLRKSGRWSRCGTGRRGARLP